MADQNKRDQSGASSAKEDKQNQTGDPGRTPGTAEGDRETVEEDIRDKERQGKI